MSRIATNKLIFLKFFLGMMRILPFQTAVIFCYTLVQSTIPAFQTLAVAEFVNVTSEVFEQKRKISSILIPLAVILGCIIFENIMPSVEKLVNVARNNKLRMVVKEYFLKKQASLQYRYIENEDACALIHRVCHQPEKNFEQGFQNIFNTMGLIIKVVSLMIIVMQASWISGICILCASIPLVFAALKTGEKNYVLSNDAIETKRRYKYLADVLSNREYAKERSLFGFSSNIQERHDELFKQAFKKETLIEEKRYANMKSGSVITIGMAMVILFVLLPGLKSGSMSAGLYIGLVSSIFGLVQSMSWRLSGIMQNYAKLKAYLREVNTFFQMEEKADANMEPEQIENFVLRSIEFCNVSFKYPGEEQYVLRNCSFKLDGNKCYSFVGRNGAGKTTITKLLVGMYDNFEGEILINDCRIQEYPFSQVKWMFSVVFQDFARYALSIRDNILFGNINKRDLQLLKRISDEIGINEFVQELPDGMDSTVGKMEDGSVDLSGGQWQKLAIARLLYSEAPINILDEPTAALDAAAEARLYELFQRVNKERFSIVITHRLGAARISDEILVIDQGRIVEQGSHEQLMSCDKGLYKEMFESQRCWYET